jgi:PRTRC genetic system protein A
MTPNQIAGYTWQTEAPLALVHTGLYYTYVTAGNGVFLEAENDFYEARLHLAACTVRGLDPLMPQLGLKPGRIPWVLLLTILDHCVSHPDQEWFFAITFTEAEGFRVSMPQEGGHSSVTYQKVPNTFIEIHSHGRMPAYFSSIDDRDEGGFCLYGVVGAVHLADPLMALRLGVYGYYLPLELRQVFG